MEAGDRLSPVGELGAFRLWGAALHFLSSGVVGVGDDPERDFSVDAGSQHLHLACAGRGRPVDVPAGAAMV
jgi:hypothetical protein